MVIIKIRAATNWSEVERILHMESIFFEREYSFAGVQHKDKNVRRSTGNAGWRSPRFLRKLV